MRDHILALHFGLAGATALLVDAAGGVSARGNCAVHRFTPRPGWSEFASIQVWQAMVTAIGQALAAQPGSRIAAIAIASQGRSALLWDRVTREPIGPCIGPHCRRGIERLAPLRSPRIAEEVHDISGMPLAPDYAAAKLAWLVEHLPAAKAAAQRGSLCAGTVDSWLLFKLTGGAVHATDPSSAAQTQLFDIRANGWSATLAALFEVPFASLPRIVASDGLFGTTANSGVIKGGIPIATMVSETGAVLFGQGVRGPGAAVIALGETTSLLSLVAAPQRSARGLATAIAWQAQGQRQFALEANVTDLMKGPALAGMLLGIEADALGGVAATVKDSGSAVFVPPFTSGDGLTRAGYFAGIVPETTRPQLARAAIEAAAFGVDELFDAMQADLGEPIELLLASGAQAGDGLLLQILADLLDRPMLFAPREDMSALGAGLMAARALGFAMDDVQLGGTDALPIEPQADNAARRRLIEKLKRARPQKA